MSRRIRTLLVSVILATAAVAGISAVQDLGWTGHKSIEADLGWTSTHTDVLADLGWTTPPLGH